MVAEARPTYSSWKFPHQSSSCTIDVVFSCTAIVYSCDNIFCCWFCIILCDSYPADFGFARYLVGADMAATLCGSPLYMVRITNSKLKSTAMCLACTCVITMCVYVGSRDPAGSSLWQQGWPLECGNDSLPMSFGECSISSELCCSCDCYMAEMEVKGWLTALSWIDSGQQPSRTEEEVRKGALDTKVSVLHSKEI